MESAYKGRSRGYRAAPDRTQHGGKEDLAELRIDFSGEADTGGPRGGNEREIRGVRGACHDQVALRIDCGRARSIDVRSAEIESRNEIAGGVGLDDVDIHDGGGFRRGGNDEKITG
jgi:hypothetical protein